MFLFMLVVICWKMKQERVFDKFHDNSFVFFIWIQLINDEKDKNKRILTFKNKYFLFVHFTQQHISR